MTNESLAYILLLFAAGILMLTLASYVFSQPRQNGIHTFAWLCIAISVYAVFYGLELWGPSPERAVLWNKLQYPGIVMIPALGLLFVLQFVDKSYWLTSSRLVLLFAIPVITIMLKFTDQWHGFIYRDLNIQQIKGMQVFDIEPGVWYWVFVSYLNLMLIAAVVFLVRFFLRTGMAFRRQAVLMFCGMIAPWVGHFIYITGNSYMGLDSSPIYFTIFGIFMAAGIFRFGLFDLLPIARESILGNMRDGVLVIDNRNRVIELNPACREVFKLAPRHAAGKLVVECFEAYPPIVEFILSGKTETELTTEAGKNKLFFHLSKTPLYGRNKKRSGNIIGFQDITQSKLSEAALIIEKQKAEAANLAKSEFLANMSHEIRTPMNAILGFTETLYHRLTDPSHKNMVQSVAASGKMLLSLLNDILDLSKIEAGRLTIDHQPTNISLMLHEIMMLFSDKAQKKGLSMTLDIQEDFPANVIIDGVRLRQILFNLIGNAVKFTLKGHVHTSLLFSPDQPAPEGTGTLEVRVTDTGIGIDSEQLSAIFEPFYQQSGQSNRDYGGTGLGLTISQRLAERMHGNIRVESEPNKGSTFFVAIPGLAYRSHVEADPSNQAASVIAETPNKAVPLADTITSNQLSNIPALVAVLRDTLLPEWQQIQDQLVIFKIEAFAKKVKSTGAQTGFAYLEAYAEKLFMQADQLDLEAMKETLVRFPEIMKELEGMIK